MENGNRKLYISRSSSSSSSTTTTNNSSSMIRKISKNKSKFSKILGRIWDGLGMILGRFWGIFGTVSKTRKFKGLRIEKLSFK